MMLKLAPIALRECLRDLIKYAIFTILIAVNVAALIIVFGINNLLTDSVNKPVQAADFNNQAVTCSVQALSLSNFPSESAKKGLEKKSATYLSSNDATQFDDPRNTGNRVYKAIGRIENSLIYAIILFICVILYTSLTSITVGNKKQLALLKLLGYRNGHIIQIITFEALFIALSGYLLGLLLAFLSNILLFTPLLIHYKLVNLNIHISILPCLSVLLLLLFATVIACSVIYLRMRKISPILLMKEE